MALDPIIAILWGVQLVVVAVFALRDAIKRRGAESTGLLLGLAIGNLPFFIGLGPAAFLPAFVIAIASAVALTFAYAATGRWKVFTVALLLVGLLIGLGNLSSLFAPIICAFACREILGLLARAVTLRRNA